MARKNTSHLSILMKELGLSGSALGDYLNIDDSLISKWKNGTRRIRMDYIDKMIDLFLSLDSKNHYQRICHISGFSEHREPSAEQLADYLHVWLSSPIETNDNDLKSFIPDLARPLNGYLFIGEDGKWDAISTYLDYTARKSGQKIWLYSQQGTDWLIKGPNHRSEWQSKNFAVLENNEIRVLHPVYKDYHHIIDYFLRWLPLHMYGNAQAYYLPRYQISYANFTICLTENSIGLVSMTSIQTPGFVTTYLLTDTESLRAIKDILSALFHESKPLFSRYSYWNSKKYHDAYRQFATGKTRGICLTAGPPLFLIRRRYLHSFASQTVDTELLDMISLEQTLKNGLTPVTIIFHLDQLKRLVRSKNIQLRTLSFYLGNPVTISQEEFRCCLLNILDFVEDHTELHVFWSEQSFFYPYIDIDMFIREREIAGFICSYDHTDCGHRALTVSEDSVVSALFHNLNFHVETHPNHNVPLSDVRRKFEELFKQHPLECCIDNPFDNTDFKDMF